MPYRSASGRLSIRTRRSAVRGDRKAKRRGCRSLQQLGEQPSTAELADAIASSLFAPGFASAHPTEAATVAGCDPLSARPDGVTRTERGARVIGA